MLTCPDFSQVKIMVIGDAMLDRYWHGDTSRISPEAPVPVVRIEKHEDRVGGSANVAVNVKALGAHTVLVCGVGKDETGQTLQTMLEKQQVVCSFVQLPNQRTTLKLRVIGRAQQLIRLDFEDKFKAPAQTVIGACEPHLADTAVIILSDYAKGILADVQEIITFAKAKGIKVIVDPKNADLSVYKGATLLTPNLSEFEAAVGHCQSVEEIECKGQALVQELALEGLLVTRGSQGMTLLTKTHPPLHISAQAREVFDITGAGDTVIAVLGACLAKNLPMAEAAKLANIAGGLSVGRFGTATITAEDINNELTHHTYQPTATGVMTLETLLPEVKRRKAYGDKIIMTNGCFDILHAGHVAYLKQARALGHCLIVAVNDDSSVKRLKGESRPINPLDQRMQVLSALGCVDYVVPFSEDTPRNLIAQILPDVLVKGGDYKPEQIAGAIEVIQNGGRVEILPFVDGCSTTQTISRMVFSVKQNEMKTEEIFV
ncbi:MAG: bifunctional D-glycero-beta-D-manno-heptose-7-phosphate kinase/D-glycero-beta-D-manno-heptose 1-phosphate adenylyltransferase HldE [Proteobacteria bacterium]|nr:bifunctional D-glycero-beta-D-manno-heptose-7-phosphate kinase/D-glycero-beta-D-manno-heptose 1-phosphate adenylyltransferase HldE [Pseudomonadota bacterium]